MEETSGGALHSSTFCCCVREIIPFHKLFLVFFLSRISAEERRSGYEDVNFGCGHGNFMIGRSFVDTVSGLKIICNSLDQPEYPLSKASESGSSAGSSSTHWGFVSNLSHIKKALCSACTHCSMSPQSRGVNLCSCSHPQNARLPVSLSSVGMTTSCSVLQFRKTSLPISVSPGGSHMLFKATQWANVEEGRCVHEVDLHKAFTILTGTRPDVVEVTRQAELFNTCAAERPFRQSSGFVSKIHVKGDGGKCEATLEGMFT